MASSRDLLAISTCKSPLVLQLSPGSSIAFARGRWTEGNAGSWKPRSPAAMFSKRHLLVTKISLRYINTFHFYHLYQWTLENIFTHITSSNFSFRSRAGPAPILLVCKFPDLHGYRIKHCLQGGYLYILLSVIPTSWFIISALSDKADFNTPCFIYSLIYSGSIPSQFQLWFHSGGPGWGSVLSPNTSPQK